MLPVLSARRIGLLHRNGWTSARAALGQIRPSQAYLETLVGTSGDPQIPDAIVAAATHGRSVPLPDSCTAANDAYESLNLGYWAYVGRSF